MSNIVSNSSGGIGFGGLLTIVFIFLKLTNHITWSWLWVFCPIWIPLAIVMLILLIVAAIMFLFSSIKS